MQYIFISLFIFFLTLTVHIAVYRLIKKIKSDSFIVLITFLPGFALNCLIIFYFSNLKPNYLDLPLTSISIYFLLSLAFIIFFLYSFLVEESPTSTILGLLRKKRKISEKVLFLHFSDYKLIDSRLEELSSQKIILEKNKHFFIIGKGRVILSIIKFYRNILGWKNFG